MSTLEEFGLEVIKHPVTKVRVQFYKGKWYVEYRRKPQFVIDAWWWFDDSIYADYKDAYVRAQTLAAEGGTLEVKRKSLEFDVSHF